jgi:hypothetical protein
VWRQRSNSAKHRWMASGPDLHQLLVMRLF